MDKQNQMNLFTQPIFILRICKEKYVADVIYRYIEIVIVGAKRYV